MNLFLSDLPTLLFWYGILTSLGLIAFPATRGLFRSFPDRGYAMAKILGFLVPAYVVWLLASLHIAPFTMTTILVVLGLWLVINLKISNFEFRISNFFSREGNNSPWKIILFEELIFLSVFLFWSYIRGHEPSIHGLEKFMDFGFINSILNTKYFPPPDMWLAPAKAEAVEGLVDYTGGFYINYYYFGHYIGAFLTKLSSIASALTYNLILSSIFAWTFVCSFSIVAALVSRIKPAVSLFMLMLTSFLGGYLVTMAGNLHTIYLLTKGYPNDDPVPFWHIWDLRPLLVTGNYNYWYPNATRFIPNTIHEFPSYSWVVADLHGHVFDIPFVLLTIGVLLSIFLKFEIQSDNRRTKLQIINSKQKKYVFGFLNLGFIWSLGFRIWDLLFIGFLCAVMYMTNAWDGLIYLALSGLLIFIIKLRYKVSYEYDEETKLRNKEIKKLSTKGFAVSISQFRNLAISSLQSSLKAFAVVFIAFILFNLPFSIHFKPFVHGIGVVGGYEIAEAVGLVKLLGDEPQIPDTQPVIQMGPFLLEKGNNLRSPVWMLGVLWGFFYFHVGAFFVYFLNEIKKLRNFQSLRSLDPIHLFILALISLSTLLLIFPEFFYAKDIYPGHYRANTMFKLGYQAFIMLSIVSTYTIVTVKRFQPASILGKLLKSAYLIFGAFLLFLVMVYPNFAIKSYYGVGENRSYEGQDGMRWLEGNHPGDYELIIWLRQNRTTEQPNNRTNGTSNVLGSSVNRSMGSLVILEAVGESYIDYARISANSGLSTVLGWPVHEWLWRGSYDEPGRRVELVRQMYEGTDPVEVRRLLDLFNVTYVVVGDLEREKYTAINENIFGQLGTIVFSSNNTSLYKVH